MPRMPKAELYAAIRRDHRGGMSMRELERKHGVTWRTVRKASDSSWPEPRKKLLPKATGLDRYKPVIDEILRADLEAPRKQRHLVTRIFHRLVEEQGADVSYGMVRLLRRGPEARHPGRVGRGAAGGARPADPSARSRAEGDFGDVTICLGDEPVTCDLSSSRLSYSGKAVHRWKNSVAVASNEPFGEAHMFRRTRARYCRNSTGSSGGRDVCGHRVGDQRDQLLRPAIRLLSCDLGSAGIADEVGTVQAVQSAASVETPRAWVSGHPREVVGIENEHAGVRADRIRSARHQRWQEPVSRGFLCHRRRHRHFPEVGADSLLAGSAEEGGHGRNSA